MPTYLQVPTSSLKKSISFYKSIKFTLIEHNSIQYASDGNILIRINTDRKSRTEIVIQDNHWKTQIKNIPNHIPVIEYTDSALISDPSGVRIRLTSTSDLPKTENFEKSIFKMNAGLSIETVDVKKSVDLYTKLGFTISQGGLDQDWLVLSNSDGFSISLMKPETCPHLFSNPSLTFFNGKDNLEIINHIRSEKLTIAEEITHFNKNGEVDNMTIMDPGGLHLFLFND